MPTTVTNLDVRSWYVQPDGSRDGRVTYYSLPTSGRVFSFSPDVSSYSDDSGISNFTFTDSKVSSTILYNGKKTIEASITAGDTGDWGRWGYGWTFPTKLRAGDCVYMDMNIYFPSDFCYRANPRLKMFRVHTRSSIDQANEGYNDWYLCPIGATEFVSGQGNTPVHYIFVKEFHDVNKLFGSNALRPNLGTWERYTMAVKLDHTSYASGGQGRVKIWKNSQLLTEILDVPTLVSANSESDLVYIFTYWNGGAPFVLTDVNGTPTIDTTFIGGTSNITSPAINAVGNNNTEVLAGSPSTKNWVDGEAITGSGFTATLVKNRQKVYIAEPWIGTHPSKYLVANGMVL